MLTGVRRWGVLGIVPVVATIAVVARRVDRLQSGPDAGVFVGMVRNLRSSFSLTSPTDQYWIRLSPAATVSRLGRIPVPDFGPLYSAVVAAVPAPLDLAFLLAHCAALLAALSAVGYLAWRATTSLPMAVAAQIIALWGPFSPDLFFQHGRPLDLYASIGSDGLAVAFLVVGLAVLTAVGPGRWTRTGVGAAVLLAAAILTRYAMAGAVVGAAVALVVARLVRNDRRWRWPVAALGAAAAWQLVVYPLLVSGAGPKSLARHRGDIAPLGVTIAGWFRVDVTGTTASAVVVILGLGLVVVALLARPGGVVAVVALAAAGQLVTVVMSRQLLDAGLNLREERHVLAVRFLLAVLVVTGLTSVLRRISPTAVTVGAMATVVLAAVAAGGWPGPIALQPRAPTLAVGPWLAAHGSLPVLSNQSDTWYTQTGRPAADLPRTIEASTLRRRDVDAEVATLAGVAPMVVQAYKPGFFDSVDLRTLECAHVGDSWTGPQLDGFELAVVDLTDCR
jgi:hypothetical protein